MKVFSRRLVLKTLTRKLGIYMPSSTRKEIEANLQLQSNKRKQIANRIVILCHHLLVA